MCGNCKDHGHSRLAKGTLEITILADGRVVIETGNFAGPSHASASAAIPAIAQALGVSLKQARKLAAKALIKTENKVTQ